MLTRTSRPPPAPWASTCPLVVGTKSSGRAYMVGERGPEVFVPTTSGQVLAHGAGGGRDVRVSIAVNGRGGESEPRLLTRSARQVARAVRGALER